MKLVLPWRRTDSRELPSPVVGDPQRAGIAVVCIVKNEALYIAEWIAFHIAAGVSAFYIYDNGSTDSTVAIARRLSESVRLEVIPWANFGKHIRSQTVAYNHAVANFGRHYRWMLFLDVDEFLFPKRDADLVSAMRNYEDKPAISLPWMMFGPSGHAHRPNGLVIDEYTERASFPPSPSNITLLNYKTIADPTAIRWAHTHYCELWHDRNGMFNDAGLRFARAKRFEPQNATSERLQLNHYFTRSLAEFEAKIAKGRVSMEGRTDKRRELSERMASLARSRVKDDSARAYAAKVHDLLATVFPSGNHRAA